MIADQNNSNDKKQTLSSQEIRKNFKSNYKNRYIGLKLLVGLSIIVIALLIYLFVKYAGGEKQNELPQSIDSVSTVQAIDPDTIKVLPQKIRTIDTAVIVKSKIPLPKLYVSGTSLDDLRENLKIKSSIAMKDKKFTPKNCRLNIKNFSFSCDLEPISSSFIKLSLLYGPVATGCESCDNALLKNPGSIVVAKLSRPDMIYNVIAISE